MSLSRSTWASSGFADGVEMSKQKNTVPHLLARSCCRRIWVPMPLGPSFSKVSPVLCRNQTWEDKKRQHLRKLMYSTTQYQASTVFLGRWWTSSAQVISFEIVLRACNLANVTKNTKKLVPGCQRLGRCLKIQNMWKIKRGPNVGEHGKTFQLSTFHPIRSNPCCCSGSSGRQETFLLHCLDAARHLCLAGARPNWQYRKCTLAIEKDLSKWNHRPKKGIQQGRTLKSHQKSEPLSANLSLKHDFSFGGRVCTHLIDFYSDMTYFYHSSWPIVSKQLLMVDWKMRWTHPSLYTQMRPDIFLFWCFWFIGFPGGAWATPRRSEAEAEVAQVSQKGCIGKGHWRPLMWMLCAKLD